MVRGVEWFAIRSHSILMMFVFISHWETHIPPSHFGDSAFLHVWLEVSSLLPQQQNLKIPVNCFPGSSHQSLSMWLWSPTGRHHLIPGARASGSYNEVKVRHTTKNSNCMKCAMGCHNQGMILPNRLFGSQSFLRQWFLSIFQPPIQFYKLTISSKKFLLCLKSILFFVVYDQHLWLLFSMWWVSTDSLTLKALVFFHCSTSLLL